jgi:hypothetical protein
MVFNDGDELFEFLVINESLEIIFLIFFGKLVELGLGKLKTFKPFHLLLFHFYLLLFQLWLH